MLVKSFTDDLAWDVQRQLVNTYFRVAIQSNADTINLSIKQKRAEAMFMNAQARLMNAETRRLKILQAERGLSQVAIDTAAVKVTPRMRRVSRNIVSLGCCILQQRHASHEACE